MGMNFTGAFPIPGIQSIFQTVENVVWWGRYEDLVFRSEVIDGATRDAGHTGVTDTLRPGLLMGKVASSGKLKEWDPSATDGTEYIYGVLVYDQKMQHQGTDLDRWVGWILVSAKIKASGVVIPSETSIGLSGKNSEYLVRAQLSQNGRFLFDDQAEGNDFGGWDVIQLLTDRHASELTLTSERDNNTLFHTLGLGVAYKVILPEPKPGVRFGFLLAEDQDFTIEWDGATGQLIIPSNNAATTTTWSSGNQIGTFIEVVAMTTGKWFVRTTDGPAITAGLIVNSILGSDADLDITGQAGTAGAGGIVSTTAGAGDGAGNAGGALTDVTGAGVNATAGSASGAWSATTGTAGTATTGTGGASGALSLVTADGGIATGGAGIGGDAGDIALTGGDGGASSDGSSGNGGIGAAITIAGGEGGPAMGTSTGAGGAGGITALSSGDGGDAAGTAAGGVGAALNLTSGDGGAKTGTGNAVGGVGGAITAVTGEGGATASSGSDNGGVGGAFTINPGDGGLSSAGTGDGGAGGAITATTGVGGTSTGGTGGAGGQTLFTSGAGGTASSTSAGGVGGAAGLVAGAGGAKLQTANANGGAGGVLNLTAGVGGTTASTGSDAGGAGGTITITAGIGGEATAGTSDGGVGGAIILVSSVGGATSGGSAGVSESIYLRSATGKPLMTFMPVPVADSGGTTGMTEAILLSSVHEKDPAAAISYQVPTGTQISNAVGGNLAVGDSFLFTLINTGNTGAEDITLTADTGVTFVGSVILAPAADDPSESSSATWRVRNTGSNTWIFYRL